jgi:drug/metabolite transporter (DMT)-like permease
MAALSRSKIAAALFSLAALFFVVFLLLPSQASSGLVAGYLLGFLAVVLHYVMSLFTNKISDQYFMWYYFGGLFVRFLIVLGLFLLLIISGKFDHLSFTVSFLISYIFHSVIDVILLNEKLTNQSVK